MLSTHPQRPPWAVLPASLIPVLAPRLAGVSQEMIEVVRREVPVYAAPLEGGYADAIRLEVGAALQRFLALAGTDRPALTGPDRLVYERLGRTELRQGRSLESLLAAYRLGARTTLRSLSSAALAAGVDPGVLIALGESVLAYVEELSAASAEGFAAAQSERAGDRDRLRDTVAGMLIRGEGDEEATRAAASAAGWPLPARLVVATMPVERWDGLRPLLGERALPTLRPGDAVVILPEPATASARASVAARLAGRDAVIGPGRPWSAAADSLRLATLARALLRRPAEAGADGVLWVDEHLTELLLLSEPALIHDLAVKRLAPLDALRPGQRERLVATLLSWLRHRGQRAAMAADLGVHEQTVGYRVNQLRDLLGPALADPDARFDLELVLRAAEASAAQAIR